MQIKRFDMVSYDSFRDQIAAQSIGCLQPGTFTDEGIIPSYKLVFYNAKFEAFSEEQHPEDSPILIPVTETVYNMLDPNREIPNPEEHIKIVKVYYSDGYSIVGIGEEEPLSTTVDLLETTDVFQSL